MTLGEALEALRSKADPEYLKGYAHFGVPSDRALGVRNPDIHRIARQIKTDHPLALELWEADIHEARLLASQVADPRQFTDLLLEKWVSEVYSWDLCDTLGKVFTRLPNTYEKAFEWASREEEFVKRQGLVTMVALAVHDKKASDEKIAAFLPCVEREASDARNFVKKAVNWLLRTIGKRNLRLNAAAIACAERVLSQATPSARWIARDALRELRSEKVLERVKSKAR